MSEGERRGAPPARGPLQGLTDLADILSDERRMSTFLRGLTIGALVGAAIAGSAIWRRRERRRGSADRDEVRPKRTG